MAGPGTVVRWAESMAPVCGSTLARELLGYEPKGVLVERIGEAVGYISGQLPPAGGGS